MTMTFWSAMFLTESAKLIRTALAEPIIDWNGDFQLRELVRLSGWAALRLSLPLSLILVSVSLTHFAQTGWLWHPQRTFPDASRLSLFAGLSRIATSLARVPVLLVKTLAFVTLLGWLMFQTVNSPSFARSLLGNQPSKPDSVDSILDKRPLQRRSIGPVDQRLFDDVPRDNISEVAKAELIDWFQPMRQLTWLTSVSAMIWGLLDYVWQRRRFEQSLRMTKAEVRQELKESNRQAKLPG